MHEWNEYAGKKGIKKDPSPGYGDGRKKGKFPTWLASATSGQPGFDRPCAEVKTDGDWMHTPFFLFLGS